jgi:hypothetical protein
MKKLYRLFLSLSLFLLSQAGISQGSLQKTELFSSSESGDARFTVTATVMDNDTWCRVTWPNPVGNPWELAYDDGEADDFFIYIYPGSLNANMFIPTFHPFLVTGGKIYVGDGSFPGPFLGTSFRVMVFDDDGEDGLPGTALDSIDVTVNNYGWVEFEGMTAEITAGNFYLAMKQLAPAPDAAPIGVDTDNPTYNRSYSYFQGSPGWVLSPLQDFMIRALITGYNEPSRAIDSFEVSRFCCFKIDESPLMGDISLLDTISLSEYNDFAWDTLDPGLYAYGVRTHFTGGEWSDYDVSNVVSHRGDGLPLPFLEQWNLGNFETNNWSPDGLNWSISGQAGNPIPAAEFYWEPVQTDYFLTLESYPLLADLLAVGQIYLDFDIRLNNLVTTGTEHLLVQVWNWESQAWTTVHAFSNEEGSFGWVSEHLDITELAMHQVFKVRFAATRENSANILRWNIDNIHVYRTCSPPLNLTANKYGGFPGMFIIEWERPVGETPPDQWIHWDDGWAVNGVGFPIVMDIDVASRWGTAQLDDFVNASLTQIAFFPLEEKATYKVRAWQGSGADSLLIDQLVITPQIDAWNYITLDNPVLIDITQELWVGYHFYSETGTPAGVDDGPAIDGYGNMIKNDGSQWQSLLEIDPALDFNWSIAAYIHYDSVESDFLKFALYRSDDTGPYFLRDYTYQNYYLDDSTCAVYMGYYNYKVTAIYASGNDTCESGFSNEEGDVCEGIYDEVQKFYLSIYPNPASDVLFIESSEQIERVSVFDSKGGQVVGWSGGQVVGWSGGRVEIPVKGLVPGLYLVRVETGSGVVGRKVVVR